MIQVRIIMQSFILRQKKSSFRKKVFYNKNAAVLLSKNNKDLIISQNLMYSLWLKIQQKLIFCVNISLAWEIEKTVSDEDLLSALSFHVDTDYTQT